MNANAPLLVVGGDPSLGSSSASQDVSNRADADASNRSSTDQDATATQSGGGTSAGRAVVATARSRTSSRSVRPSKTLMRTRRPSRTRSAQTHRCRSSVITLSGTGTSSAHQKARNNADGDASNKSDTDQDATRPEAGRHQLWWRLRRQGPGAEPGADIEDEAGRTGELEGQAEAGQRDARSSCLSERRRGKGKSRVAS